MNRKLANGVGTRITLPLLRSVKEDRNVLLTTERRKANWFGHILRRNCHLRQVIEGKV